MRVISAVIISVLLAGGYLTSGSGGRTAAVASDGARSQRVDAPPSAVMSALRDTLESEGLDVVSRADGGDHFRQVIPAHALATDPELSRIARFGDLVTTARVGSDEAVVTTAFTQIATSATYRIAVTASDDGKSSRVAIETSVEEGSSPEARRIGRNLRVLADRNAGKILTALAAATRS